MRLPHLTILAADPGGRDTGLVVIRTAGPELLDRATVTSTGPTLGYGAQVIDGGYHDAILAVLDGLAAAHDLDAVAIETVTAPRGRAAGRDAHQLQPAGPMATAAVAATVRTWAWVGELPVVLVTPDGHGQGFAGYPPALLDKGGKPLPGGARRHERSAYDVALAAAFDLRVAAGDASATAR